MQRCVQPHHREDAEQPVVPQTPCSVCPGSQALRSWTPGNCDLLFTEAPLPWFLPSQWIPPPTPACTKRRFQGLPPRSLSASPPPLPVALSLPCPPPTPATVPSPRPARGPAAWRLLPGSRGAVAGLAPLGPFSQGRPPPAFCCPVAESSCFISCIWLSSCGQGGPQGSYSVLLGQKQEARDTFLVSPVLGQFPAGLDRNAKASTCDVDSGLYWVQVPAVVL